jgi:hypothetical protein
MSREVNNDTRANSVPGDRRATAARGYRHMMRPGLLENRDDVVDICWKDDNVGNDSIVRGIG